MKKNKSWYVIFGYGLIIFGILLPLGGFSSMTYRRLSQDSRYEKYMEEIGGAWPIEMNKAIAYDDEITSNNIVDPFTDNDYNVDYDFWDEDEVFSYLSIPAINLREPVYLGASDENLERGVSHVHGTSLPIGRPSSRSLIAGHRGWYGDVVFLNLNLLSEGDVVYLDGPTGRLTYEVYQTELIDSHDWDKVQPIEGEDILTLMTCDPIIPPYPSRLIVNCKRIGDESESGGEDKADGQERVEDRNLSPESSKKDEKAGENEEAPQAEEKIEQAEVDGEGNSLVKKLDYLIYFITGTLILLLVFVIIKLVRYLKS